MRHLTLEAGNYGNRLMYIHGYWLLTLVMDIGWGAEAAADGEGEGGGARKNRTPLLEWGIKTPSRYQCRFHFSPHW